MAEIGGKEVCPDNKTSFTPNNMTRKEYHKERYHRLKDNGLCVQCGKPIDRKGARCISCLNNANSDSRETYKYYQDMGICPRCRKNKIYGDEKVCLDCSVEKSLWNQKKRKKDIDYKNHQEWSKNAYKTDKEKGVCPRCRKRKPTDGYVVCKFCREKMRRSREKNRKPDRSERYLQGLCYFCDNPVEEGYKVCREHHKKNIAYAHIPRRVKDRLMKEYLEDRGCIDGLEGNGKDVEMDLYNREVQKRIDFLCK